jgi:hypothetical protein
MYLAVCSTAADLDSKDKFSLHSKSMVCADVDMKGDITVGAGATKWS